MGFRSSLYVLFSLTLDPTLARRSNNTTVKPWVLEPDGCGTFELLRSCVLTLSLCGYIGLLEDYDTTSC